jgi:hypothetical protein
VYCKVNKLNRVWNIPGPPEAAAMAVTALLSLGTMSNLTRLELAMITPDLAAASAVAMTVAVGGGLAGILLPSLPRKMRKTSSIRSKLTAKMPGSTRPYMPRPTLHHDSCRRRGLSDSKVRHPRADKSDPNFDWYNYIQLQNN